MTDDSPREAIARVAVEVALDREFDYLVPPGLAGRVRLGSRVVVPFGRTRNTGYVVGFAPSSAHVGLKALQSLAAEEPFIDEAMLGLARWMADYYCAPLERAIRTVLPGAVRRRDARFKARKFVERVEPPPAEDAGRASRPAPKQAAVLALLAERGGLFLDELLAEAGVTAAPVEALARRGLVRVEPRSMLRSPLAGRTILPTSPLALMPEQEAALRMVCERLDARPAGAPARPASRVVLLHGVTGSGKTEVYMQAIAHALRRGEGAIVLVPEIALTPQTVGRFVARFGNGIAVLHSHLSDGERHDEWHRIRSGEARVVVGARSAVFAPVRALGLIVVDEEHEPSYKQDEAPRYNARDVAVMRGYRLGCAVLLGSATPALESWYNTQTGKYALACLPRRADDRKMPAVRVVDMRVEAQRTGKPSVFSTDLVESIRRRLDRAEQTILFLNRRGYSTSLLCPKCGYVANCGQCSVSYTYHRTEERLRCHICGADREVPAHCPACRDPQFRYAGVGTQRVEAILQKLYPRARVARLDTDVTRRKDSYERILGAFRVGKIDILIGTQMIAKGLHFPNVTLVGVIYADLSLHMPDFRAGERTFQLLAQVAGRAGRGDVAGEVIVQTYTPFHWAVQAARRVDYQGLCDQELAFRRELNYPPFAHLVCIGLRGASEERVRFCAETLARELKGAAGPKVTVADAAPAPLARARGQYRYQVMLRSASTRTMATALRQVLRAVRLPKDVTAVVDVDALNLL